MRPMIAKLMGIGAAVAVCCLFGQAANAQRGTVAISPIVFDNAAGTPDGRAETIREIRATLMQNGFTVVDYDTAKSTWTGLGISMPSATQMPAPSDLMRFGQAAGADYVLTGEFDFNANRTWSVGSKYTTVKATINVFKTSDGSNMCNRTETISKTTLAPGDFATLSRSDREKRVVDEAVDVTLAGFTRLMKLILH